MKHLNPKAFLRSAHHARWRMMLLLWGLVLFSTQAFSQRAQISLPITWQDSATTDLTTTDFGGTISSIQADPVNASRIALRIIKDQSAQTWAGTTLSTPNGLAANIPFAANANKMQVVVYSPATGLTFRLKAEDKNDPTKSVETDVTTTVANAWDTLTFDFASQSAGTAAINYSFSYNKLSIFPNFGTTGTTQTFFIGYVNHVPASGGGGGGTTRAQISLPITWQDSATTDLTTVDFGGTVSSLQADPTNASRVALRIVKDATAQTWAGTTLSTPNGLAANIPFAANANKMQVVVYSPATGVQFKLKAEDKNDPTKSVETDVTTTVANAWDTLTFDFASQSAGTAAINYSYSYNKLSIFPNFGTTGTTQTFYIGYVNHLPASGGGGGGTTRAQISLPITWQDSATTDLTTVDFGGTISSLQADPTNASRVALRIVKDATAQTWAGTTLSTANGLAANIPFAANANKMQVVVYSPATGLTFRLKAEDKNDPTKSVETDVTTTVANAWDTLTFDFASQSAGTAAINYSYSYNKLSIFPNFGTTGTTQTFFIGYVNHVPASGGGGGGTTRAQISLPITWQDSATTDLTTVDFGGTVSSLQADPTNASRVALRIVKDATAQTWAGTTLSTPNGLAANIPFAANANLIKVQVYSPAAGLTFRLKAEDKNDPTKSVETDVTTTVANAWDTLTFNFANHASGTQAINYATSYNKLSIFPNFGTTGVTQTFFIGYINHVTGGGGGGTTRAQISLPITWQDSATTDLTTTDFGGTISSLQADPTNANRVALQIVKDATAQTWAGTTLSTPNGLAANIPFAANANLIKVQVYSPAAGLTFRLKAEDKNDPTKSVETDVTTTVANAWDTLTFNFANHASGTQAINYATSYNKLSIFPNFGTTGVTQTFFIGYINHVTGGGGGGTTRAQISLPITWQDSATTDLTTVDFGGTVSSLQADPTNANRVALRIVKDATAQTWAGTTFSTPNGLAANIPFAANANLIKVQVYSPAAGLTFRLKAEDKNDPTKSVETDVTTTVANAWDTLTFNFANHASGTQAINYATSYNKLSIFPNFGTTGVTQTFFIGYINHVTGGGGGTTRAQIRLPITWQDSATTDLTTTDFGGTVSSLQADPTNASRVALRIVKDATAQTWAGTTLSTPNGLAANIPFATNANLIKVQVYSPAAGLTFRLKAEDKNDPTKSVETDVTTTVANAWDTLTFNFANHASGTQAINYATSYNKLSIFPNFGTTGVTQTFFIGYINHVTGGGGGGTTRAQIRLPITWQDSATTDLTTTDFGGTVSSLQADPTNATRVALRIVKDATAQTWAGTTLSTPNGLAANIPFAANANLIKVQVYSPAVGLTFRLKAEDKNDPTKSVETDVTTTVANAWDTLTFNFANHASGTQAINYATSYNKLSIFPNFGTTGVTQTFFIGYVNHVPASGGGGGGTTRAQISLPITWQDSATTDLTTVDFGGTVSSLQADPTNANRVALQIVKDATAQTWAGTTLSTTNGLAANIPFAANANKMQVVVYSPATGVQFKLKAEDKNDPTKSVETDVTTTVANAWDTLTFDFASQSAGTAAINYSYSYNKLSIFPNFGTTGTTQTFYIGYVNHVPASGGGGGGTTRAQISLPITWQDSATTDLTTVDFGGTVSSLQADPTNASRVALRIVKDATAQTWAGTTLSTPNGLAANIPFAANANKMQVVVYSPATGVQFKLKAEDKNDPTKSVETDVTTTVANAWDTLTFDFASQSAGTAAINYSYSYNKLSIFPNFGTTGVTQTFFIGYINHVTGGGGGGTTRAQISLPITWQDSATTDLTTTDFGGTISSLQADPTNASRVALRIVKDATAQTWAGTTLSTPNGLAANIPFAANANLIKVQVYSPAAGLTFRLKAEDKNDPTKSVETDVTTTVANAWDTLTFDFASQSAGTAAINYSFSYNKLSIFPNFGTTGVTQTFFIGYINHVTGGGGGGTTRAQISLPITWQDSATTDLTTTDFGGTVSSLQADPTNASRVALRIVKDATAQTWAGTTLSTPNGLAANIPFAANANLIKVQVYSPAVGLTFRLKAEDKNDPTKSVETDVTTTVANAWDTLTFNFANHASGTQAINYATSYNKLSIFPNFGNTGTTQTFFIGYVNHTAGGSGGGTTKAQISLPITWQDSATTDLTTTDFGGTASALAADPVSPNRIALSILKTAAAQSWAGTTFGTPNGFATNIPFTPNSNQMQVQVYAPAAGMVMRLKAEDKNDPTKSVETDATTTVANAWHTLTFNFANHASGTQAINYTTSYNKLSIFPNFNVSGATSGALTFFIGQVAFGTITGTNNLIQTGELLIYPNPNAGTFQLNAPAMEGKEVNVQLLDVSGKKVHEENIGAFTNNQTLSVNGLRDGLYFCRISSGDQVAMQKIVIRN